MKTRGPLRVLILLSGGGFGGNTTGALHLLRNLNPSRIRPVVLLTSRHSVLQDLHRLRIPSFCLPQRNRLEFLLRLIRKEKVGLVHSCDAAGEGAQAAYALGIPHLWTVGGIPEETFAGPSRKAVEALRTLIELLSDAVVFPTRTLAREQFPELSARKRYVIPWGIDPLHGSRRHPPGWLRRKFHLPADAFLVALVGNFYPAKRHLDFLQAVKRIHQAEPNSRFLIAGNCVGNPPWGRQRSMRYRRRIQETIRKFRLQGIVTLTHFHPKDRLDWFPEFHLLLIPSREGISQALLEAGACGVPVVAAKIGGSPEVIQHRRSGLLVPYRDPVKLAEASLWMMRHPAEARRFGAALRRRILTRYPASRQTTRFERLYTRLYQRTRTPYLLRMASRRIRSHTPGLSGLLVKEPRHLRQQ